MNELIYRRNPLKIILPLLSSSATTLIMLLCLVSPSMGQPEDASSWPQDGPWVVRAFYPDSGTGRDYAAKLAPWEFHGDDGYFIVEVDIQLMDSLVEAGFQLELDVKKTEKLASQMIRVPGQRSGIPGYPCYRTVEETYTTAQQMVTDYPNLAEWTSIGESWERTQNASNGYPIMVLHLTNKTITSVKPVLFIMSAIHSRELTTAELNTRFAEYLLQNYGTDADVTWLLDYRDIYLVLQVNPDGRKMAETGLSWRKNTNSDLCSSGSAPNGPGIDLNRNFPFQWACCGGSSSTPCDVTYHGTAALSEPESQAVVDFARTVITDYRDDDLVDVAPPDTSGVFMDFHSYGGDVLWPWGFAPSTQPPNADGLFSYARKLAYFNGYTPRSSSGPVDGATKDFAYGEFGIPAYTIELGSSFFEDCSSFESTVFPDNMPMLIYAAKSCDTPYMTGKGPNSLDVTYAQTGQDQGVVTATFDDSLSSTIGGTDPVQNIVEAKLSLGTPLFLAGAVPQAMTPVDGTWDSPRESAELAVDLSSLGVGSHPVFVQGKDADGNWGTISSIFVHVLSNTTYIEGTLREDGSLAPLVGTIRAGDFQAVSGVNGHYRLYVTPGTYDITFSADGYKDVVEEHVSIVENQVVVQNAILKPYCDFFAEDAELGLNGWTTTGSWALTTQYAHGGTHSWTDSPDSDYASSQDTYLVSPVVDLSDAQDVKLSFWHRFDLENTYDLVHLEYRLDAGPWQRLASFNGSQPDWTKYTLNLPQWDQQANVQFQFYFHSDSSVVKDGYYMDDLKIEGTGPLCSPELTWEALLENWPEHSVDELVNYINTHP